MSSKVITRGGSKFLVEEVGGKTLFTPIFEPAAPREDTMAQVPTLPSAPPPKKEVVLPREVTVAPQVNIRERLLTPGKISLVGGVEIPTLSPLFAPRDVEREELIRAAPMVLSPAGVERFVETKGEAFRPSPEEPGLLDRFLSGLGGLVPGIQTVSVPEFPKLDFPEFPKLDFPEFPKLDFPEFPKLDFPEFPKLPEKMFEKSAIILALIIAALFLSRKK